MMGDACDTDDDNDNVADTADSCPAGSLNAASGDDTTPTADPDGDGCKNSEDMDDVRLPPKSVHTFLLLFIFMQQPQEEFYNLM